MEKNKFVEIKGSKTGIVVLLAEEPNFEDLKTHFAQVLQDKKKFFGNAVVEINMGKRNCSLEHLKEIASLIDEYSNIFLKRIVNSQGDILVDFSDIRFNLSEVEERFSSGEQRAGKALVLRKTVRSGQKVSFQGHVVILGDINPGAEVEAGGDIIVMGAVRGMAHAGKDGDVNASVTALRLLPTQLRIAGVISRSPDEETTSPDTPEYAFISGDRIMITSLYSSSG